MSTVQLSVVNTPERDLVWTNHAYVSSTVFSDMNLWKVPHQGLVLTVAGSTSRDHLLLNTAQHDKLDSTQIGLNSVQRKFLNVRQGDTVTVSRVTADDVDEDSAPMLVINTRFASSKVVRLEKEHFALHIMSKLAGQYLCSGQEVLIQHCDDVIVLKVSSGAGWLESESSFDVCAGQNVKMHKKANVSKRRIQELGIGGLDAEFEELVRRAFASRSMPPHIFERLGVKHVKGVLLHGPAGAGKTTIARKLGELLGCKTTKLVNGPEILNKFVGESERNIRELFKDAEEAQARNDPDIHVIIFDEIDAICKARGSSGAQSGVNDSVVNQLLTKMDGVNALDNILVIGLTNRKDMLDPALLRPGRMEVHVEIGYPDAQGRREIFDIHTAAMKRNGYLGQDVNVEDLVARTKHYTGAEIEGVVKSATSYAMARVQEKPGEPLVVGMADVYLALNDTKPAFASSALRDDLSDISLSAVQCELVHSTLQHEGSRHRILVTGEDGLLTADYLAYKMAYETVKVVKPLELVCMSEQAVAHAVKSAFLELDRCSESVLILQGIDALVQYCSLGPVFSNLVWQTLKQLLERKPVKDNRLIVIGVCKHDFAKHFDLANHFDVHINACLP